MSETSITVEWRDGGRHSAESKYEGRQSIITKAARTCFERKGVAKTSIADITREVDITRELFYYYFPNKGVVVDAVMDTFVVDAQNMLAELASTDGVLEGGVRGIMVAVMDVLRIWVNTDADAQLPMTELLRETGRWPQVAYRVADTAVKALQTIGVVTIGADEASINGLRMALIGSMMVMQCNDEVSSEELAAGVLPLL